MYNFGMGFLQEVKPKQLDSHTPRREWWLFAGGLALYLLTRLVALDKFPIYFFSDEAIQTLTASDLLHNGLRGPAGNLLPVFFQNGGQYNLSASVYLQLLVAWLPRSVWLTRGLPALLSVGLPLSLTFALKDSYKVKGWWLTPWVVSTIPCWFLHSRTAFETALGTTFYAVFLYFYLRYRLKDRSSLPLALLFGALAFYTYSPLELVVVLSGLAFLIVDWRYHWQDKRSLAVGALALIVFALPFALFRWDNRDSFTQHLSMLQSYWLDRIPLAQKLGMFLARYVKGLNPLYWFFYNAADLVRHQMKGMGHLPLYSLPLMLLGLALAIRNWKQPAWRVPLIALFCAPAGAALVDLQINRALVMVVPATLLACLGLQHLFSWLEVKLHRGNAAPLVTLVFLGLFSVGMTAWALVRGPLWYPDYGLYGMQWGAKEVFDASREYLDTHPDESIEMSPSWANATDVLARYFLGDPVPLMLGSIEEYTLYQKPLSRQQVFVLSPNEYDWALSSGKFTDVEIVRVLPWPDGRPGFYFIKLSYVDNIEAIFTEELAERRKPETEAVTWLGQTVTVTHPKLDIGTIAAAFDGDTNTLIRSFEANPLTLELSFTEPVSVASVSVWLGNSPTQLKVSITPADGTEVIQLTAQDEGQESVHPLTLQIAKPVMTQQMTLEILSLNEPEPAHVHVWEVGVR